LKFDLLSLDNKFNSHYARDHSLCTFYLQDLPLVTVAKVSSEGPSEGAIPTRVVSMGIVSLTDTTEQCVGPAGMPGVSSMG